MDTLAPPVVAVIVTHDPGPWFEETLTSFAAQDYRELAVLVLDAGSREDPTARVASVLPSAYVRRLDANPGFGAAVNEARDMVDGADYFLVCHDDVALAPDAVHLLVEEAFRSNAGIVSPKLVDWDDPGRLLHVGMSVDKGGSVIDRVHGHEIDHGQHDAVRDVFVAPGAVTLIRADLFGELGGFDPAIVAMGEDLDLCWRAQLAGARVIVVPDARVRHREELASGSRPLDPGLSHPDGEASPTLQELQRRHELLVVLKCYGRPHLVRVVPQIALLSAGEIVVARLGGNRARARAVSRAWRWNLGRLSDLRAQRRRLRDLDRVSDREIRLLQMGGSDRLSSYGRRVLQLGFHGVHADELAAAADNQALEAAAGGEPATAAPAGGPALPAAVGTTPPLPTPPDPARPVPSPEEGAPPVASPGPLTRSTAGSPLVAWLVAALLVVIGTRGVLGGRLPVVGQLVPFPSWSATFSQFAAGWHPSGVGTTAPASPALALVGLAGTVLFGAMGLAQKLLVLGCVPVGVWGVVRLVRPFGSRRGPLVAGLSYLAMALPYDALSQGRWDALTLYAGIPWVLGALCRATGLAPFERDRPGPPGGGRRPWLRPGSLARQAVALGLVEAVLVSFAPAAAAVVVLVAGALVGSSLLWGSWSATLRALAAAVGATVVAAVVCLPWLVGVLASGGHALDVLGVPLPGSAAPTWGSLLRFAVGPIGGSPLGWGFALAAAVTLVLARGERFGWAGRLWSVTLVAWLATWVIGRGWLGSLAIQPLVLLTAAAAATAGTVGIGVSVFEVDLRSARFGWRQLAAVVAAAVVVLGAVPTMVSALPGRWDLPVNDFSQSVRWMQAQAAEGPFRVLWLGDARALNQGSWSGGDGLAYATSEDGAPDARWLWNAANPGPTAQLADAVDLARARRTDRLGRLLAPAGVRYVVVVTAVAPVIAGEQSPQSYPVPSDLGPGLARQLDLSPVVSGTGITVYANASWLAVRAESPHANPATTAVTGIVAGAPGAAPVPGAVPVLPGPPAARSVTGRVSAGTVLAALAPSDHWSLTQSDGRAAARSASFGWATQFRVVRAGTAVLHFDGGVWAPLSLVVSVLTWLAVIAVLLGRRRAPGTPSRRRRRSGSEPEPEPEPQPQPAGTRAGEGR